MVFPCADFQSFQLSTRGQRHLLLKTLFNIEGNHQDAEGTPILEDNLIGLVA
jgi:hypothetical protein